MLLSHRDVGYVGSPSGVANVAKAGELVCKQYPPATWTGDENTARWSLRLKSMRIAGAFTRTFEPERQDSQHTHRIVLIWNYPYVERYHRTSGSGRMFAIR